MTQCCPARNHMWAHYTLQQADKLIVHVWQRFCCWLRLDRLSRLCCSHSHLGHVYQQRRLASTTPARFALAGDACREL